MEPTPTSFGRAQRRRARRRNRRRHLAVIAAVVIGVLLVAAAFLSTRGSDNEVKSTRATRRSRTSATSAPTTIPPTTTPPTTTPPATSPVTTVPPVTSTVARAEIKLGSRGSDVVALQQRLTALGYKPGPADGDFSSTTESAVVAFQKAKGLPADGVVGAKTWEALNAAQ